MPWAVSSKSLKNNKEIKALLVYLYLETIQLFEDGTTIRHTRIFFPRMESYMVDNRTFLTTIQKESGI